MSKSRISIVLILILLATSITFAQSFFNSKPKVESAPKSSSPKPLSPDEFKALVKQQTQQTQKQMTQEVKQQISSKPFKLPGTPSPQKSPPQSSTDEMNFDNTSDTTNATTVEQQTTTTEKSPGFSGSIYGTPASPSTPSSGSSTTSTPKQGIGIQY